MIPARLVKPPRSAPGRPIKLGVVANEFFDLELGRMGGFGWATRQVARCFQAEPSRGVEVVFLSGEPRAAGGKGEVHGTRLLLQPESRLEHLRRLRAERLDLLLMIDYRPSYRFFARALPRTPILVWVRDPRPPEDVAKIATLRIPGAAHVRPAGVDPIDCTSLAGVVRLSRWLRRPVLFATPAPFLGGKVKGTYGVEAEEVFFLPNIIDLDAGTVTKHPQPRVVFLARLDPYKRPWLAMKLAQQFPEVEFLFLGQAYVRGEGAWEPGPLPANVRLLGHLDGDEKVHVLSSAWALVNTSIHEGLAVSFLEALACETPVLSCQDPERVVSRFGIYTGRCDGDGLDGLPRLTEGLRQLLRDGERRSELGRSGRQWVARTHSRARFLEAFGALRARAGVT
jgi:glycosyltransferase involved in cell wall biosynthesis